MKKILSTLMVALCVVLPCTASNSLIIRLADGAEVICNLEKQPQMSFGDKTLSLTSLDGSVGEWNFTDVDSWSFSEASAINQTMTDGSRINIEGDVISVEGVAPKEIAVYDINGKKVSTTMHTSAQRTAVSLNGMAKGVYILKAGNSSLKFIAK